VVKSDDTHSNFLTAYLIPNFGIVEYDKYRQLKWVKTNVDKITNFEKSN